MFDLIIHEELTDRQLLLHIAKELKAMAVDVSKLNTATTSLTALVAANKTAVEALIALHTDPAAQAAVDAAVGIVDVASSVVSDTNAAIATAVTAPAPAA